MYKRQDLGWRSINKYGEQLCGDRVQIVEPSADSVVMVLACLLYTSLASIR